MLAMPRRQVALIGHCLLEVDRLACLMLPHPANPLMGQAQACVHEVCSFAECGMLALSRRQVAFTPRRLLEVEHPACLKLLPHLGNHMMDQAQVRVISRSSNMFSC